MPTYDYMCDDCGPFTAMRPMAECEKSHACPECGGDAPRAYITAPYFAALAEERRVAHAINERSAAAPQLASQMKADRGKGAHGAGCGCCSGKSSAKRGRNGAKMFPSKRPWMISH
jgi:putative FmdB family regulatory protein